MLMFINSCHHDLKIWLKWDSPYQSQVFFSSKESWEKWNCFQRTESLICICNKLFHIKSMECFTFLNVTKAICFQQCRISTLFTKKRLFSIFCLLPTMNFQREQPELHACIRLLMPWAKSKIFWPFWKFSLTLPLWQTKYCHLLPKPELPSISLFPTPRHNAQDTQQRLLQPRLTKKWCLIFWNIVVT